MNLICPFCNNKLKNIYKNEFYCNYNQCHYRTEFQSNNENQIAIINFSGYYKNKYFYIRSTSVNTLQFSYNENKLTNLQISISHKITKEEIFNLIEKLNKLLIFS